MNVHGLGLKALVLAGSLHESPTHLTNKESRSRMTSLHKIVFFVVGECSARCSCQQVLTSPSRVYWVATNTIIRRAISWGFPIVIKWLPTKNLTYPEYWIYSLWYHIFIWIVKFLRYTSLCLSLCPLILTSLFPRLPPSHFPAFVPPGRPTYGT